MNAGYSADVALAAAEESTNKSNKSSKRSRSKKVKVKTWKNNKEKNGGIAKCDKCDKEVSVGKKLQKGDKVPSNRGEVDHTKRLADGGEDTPENAKLLCHECHKEKTRKENSK